MANEYEDQQPEIAGDGTSSTDYQGILGEAQGKQIADPDRSRAMADAEAPIREKMSNAKALTDEGIWIANRRADRAGERAGDRYDQEQAGHQELDPDRAEAIAYAADDSMTKATKLDTKAEYLKVRADVNVMSPTSLGLIGSNINRNRAEKKEAKANDKRADADERAAKAGKEYDQDKSSSV